MASPTEISQSVAPTKRRFADADADVDTDTDCEVAEFKKPKPTARKYPPPKIRIGVEFDRDFPPGCGIKHDSIQVEKNPLKKLENVDSNLGTLTAHVNDKIVNSQIFEDNKSYNFGSKLSRKVKYWDPMKQVVHDFPPGIIKETKTWKNFDNVNSKTMKCRSFENNKKVKSFKLKELGFKKPCINSRPDGKVKFLDPGFDAQISKDTNYTVDSRRREKIRETMTLFDEVYNKLLEENGTKKKGEKIGRWRFSTKVAKIVKQKLKWMNPEKSLGEIRGVHPGDRFKFRSQLQMVGLHCQPHCGIDYTNINGKSIALSIVDSHRYSNSGSCDVLSYCGEGGVVAAMFGFSGCNRKVEPDDQKLERGNLALKNSINEKNPVRVIRKVFGVGVGKNNEMFVYDGLYNVEDCTQKRGSEGKLVFMFQLHKIPGQPQFQKMVNGSRIPGDVALYHYSTFQMLD